MFGTFSKHTLWASLCSLSSLSHSLSPLRMAVFISDGVLETGTGYGRAAGTWRWLRLLVVPFLRRTSDAVAWSLYSCSPRSSQPQPLGSGGDAAPCKDTREDHELSFYFSHQVLLQCVVFKCRFEGLPIPFPARGESSGHWGPRNQLVPV